MERTYANVLRLVVAVTTLYFVAEALLGEFFGSLQYFTYTGSLVGALVLLAIVAGRLDERHVVLVFSMATIIHVVYLVLLVGPDGIVDDLLTGGAENLVLHYLPPYLLLLDLAAFSTARRYLYRDGLTYLLVPVAYLGYVAIYGQVAREYPYFFLNVPELGVAVLAYVVAIAAFFVGLNLLVIAIKRRTLAWALARSDARA
jgi:hypothetical protein